jgi:hypothetical protein
MLYPDFSRNMLITQTIQLSSYLLSAIFSATFLCLVAWRRLKNLRGIGVELSES